MSDLSEVLEHVLYLDGLHCEYIYLVDIECQDERHCPLWSKSLTIINRIELFLESQVSSSSSLHVKDGIILPSLDSWLRLPFTWFWPSTRANPFDRMDDCLLYGGVS